LFQRLKLKYDEPLSNFAFKFNLRPYSKVANPNDLIQFHKSIVRQGGVDYACRFILHFVDPGLLS